MKQVISITLLLLFSITACHKEDTSVSEEFPEWLQAKITELVPDQNLCKITDVTIIEFKGEKYFHVYCGIWSCMYCQLFDKNGNRPAWESNVWNDFFANQKVLKTVPACR